MNEKSDKNPDKSALTAKLIKDYVAQKDDLAGIKKDFSDNKSRAYTKLDQYKAQTTGVLWYGITSIEDYLVSCTNQQEKDILTELSTLLKDIKEDPNNAKNFPKIDALQDTIARWMEHIASVEPKTAAAESLCKALYTILNINRLDLKYANLSFKMIAKGFSFDLTAQVAKIETLLQRTENASNTIRQSLANQKPITPPPIELHSAPAQNASPKYPEDHDDKKTNRPNLQTNLESAAKAIENLIILQNKTAEIAALENLLEKAEANDTSVIGRAYFKDFIQEHQSSFDLLLSKLSNEEKEAFEEAMAPIMDPTEDDANTQATLFAISTAASIPTAIFRWLAPAIVQNFVQSIAPETPDSVCKKELKKHLHNVLPVLKEQLQQQRKTDTIEPQLRQLANNNRLLEQKITAASTPPVTSATDTETNAPLTLHENFASKYVEILGENAFEEKSLDALKNALDADSETIQTLINIHEKIASLKSDIASLEYFCKIEEINPTATHPIFKEFTNNRKDIFALISKELTEKERSCFESAIQYSENKDGDGNKEIQTLLYSLSRHTALNVLMKKKEELIPEEEKSSLLIAKLANGKSVFEKQLARATEEELLNIKQQNTEVSKKIVTPFLEEIANMQKIGEKIKEIAALDAQLTGILTENNKKIEGLFSWFKAIFYASDNKKIMKIRLELENMTKEYQNDLIKKHMEINANPHIEVSIKNKLKRDLLPLIIPNNAPIASNSTEKSPEDHKRKFKAIKSDFHNAKRACTEPQEASRNEPRPIKSS